MELPLLERTYPAESPQFAHSRICLAANVHLSAYWRALSALWLTRKLNPPLQLHPILPTTCSRPLSPSSALSSVPTPSLHRPLGNPPIISHFHAAVRPVGGLGRPGGETFLTGSAAAVPETNYAVDFWIILFTGVCQAFVFRRTETITYFPSLSVNSALIKAVVAPLLPYHVGLGINTQSLLWQRLQRGGRWSCYSHPTPPPPPLFSTSEPVPTSIWLLK